MKKLFTLIELIVVIVIIGILAAIVIPNVSDTKREAIVSMMEGNIRNIQSAVDMYQLKNDGNFPSINQPTLEKPQKVEFSLLYPKYIKSLPNEQKVPEQKYWVDVYGKVWGSTIDAPSSFYESDSNIEWISQEKATGYNYYEIASKETTSKVYDKVISLKKALTVNGLERIQLANSNQPYLVSSIDQYGLETAPVGPQYQGLAEDWFTPILKKEGTFFIEFGSSRLMYWDRFWTQEDKPEGTNIKYRFSVQNENETWTEYIEDFYKLEPSKRIRVEVQMIGNGIQKPSLLDMRIDYHFAGGQVEYFKPTLISLEQLPFDPNLVGNQNSNLNSYFYRYDIPTNKYISNISSSYGTGGSNLHLYNASGVTIGSLSQVNGGSSVYISTDYYSPYNPPLIELSSSPLPIHRETKGSKTIPALDYLVDMPEVKDSEWITIDGFNLFFFAGSNESVDWINSVVKDNKPQHTRILYYYTPNQESDWGLPYSDIAQVPNSRAIKVGVILQVEKDYLGKVQKPEFTSMTINHVDGSLSANPKGGDFLMITPKKLNDLDKQGYYSSTKIEWDYIFDNANGDKVVDVEWSSNKKEQYDAGTYNVSLRVKTDKGAWTDWVENNITIKSEPRANYYLNGSNNFIVLTNSLESVLGANPMEYTYEMWFTNDGQKVQVKNGYTTKAGILISDYHTTTGVDPTFGLGLTINTDNQLTVSSRYNSTLYNSSPIIVPIGSQNHIAVTMNKVTLKMHVYLNGELVFTRNIPNVDFIDNTTLRIGAQYDSAYYKGENSYYHGNIGDVRLWNRALSQEEIKSNMYKALTGAETGLKGYWKLNEQKGTTIYDYSGNNHNATLYGDLN